MDFIVEPNESYSLEQVSEQLTLMSVPHIIIEIEGQNVIKAEMTFDEVCSLKNMAYCTHKENYHDT